MADDEPKKEERSISRAVEAFVVEVDALADTLPLVIPLVAASGITAQRDWEQFLSRCTPNDNGTFQVSPDEYANYTNTSRRLNRNRRALQIIPRSFLTSLVSHYDAFVGSVLRAALYLKPQIISSFGRQFSVKEILAFESIDAIREGVIEREVETVLRDSHEEQFKWMEKTFSCLFRDESWPRFIEVTERRNLFVHCNGIVSAQYLAVCAQHGVDCKNLKIGQELHVSTTYFQTAYSTIIEVGLKLAYVLWRRLKPEDILTADTSLINICLNLIRDEKYVAAQSVLDFGIGCPRFGNEESRRIMILNRAQAYKWGGDDKKNKEILAAEDWNAANEKLRLGAAVLNDDFATAVKVMNQIGHNGPPAKGDYKEWPIFKVFRTSKEFMAAYRQVFGEDFSQTATKEVGDNALNESVQ